MAKKKTKKNSKNRFNPWVLILGFAILLGVLIATRFGLAEQKEAMDWVIHTSEVKTNIRKLLSDLQDAETGQRGFLVTDELRYLEPFEAGLEDTPITLQDLNELTSDNPLQKANIEEIQILINKKFAELQQTINLTRMGSKEAAIEVGKLEIKDIHILLIDDDKIVHKAMRRVLEEKSIANPLLTAKNGEEGLAMLKSPDGPRARGKPLLIILDLNMPRMDGLEFLKELMGSPKLKDIPVFVLTTSKAPTDLGKAFDLGAMGYLVKDELSESFEKVLEVLKQTWRFG